MPSRRSRFCRARCISKSSCGRCCPGGASRDPGRLMSSQLVLPLEPRNAMTRADFIEAPGNVRAIAFLDAWPDWPAPAAALSGPSASGKTHLARIWAARSGAVLADARTLREPIAGAAVVENCDSVTDHDHEPSLFAML